MDSSKYSAIHFCSLLAKCNGVHWLTTRDYDLLLQTSGQVVILRRDGFVLAVICDHTLLHVYMVELSVLLSCSHWLVLLCLDLPSVLDTALRGGARLSSSQVNLNYGHLPR